MVDKLRRTFPLNITFTEGEQPSAAKLTAIALQARNGLGVIEAAIGDLWNQSGDPVLYLYPLQLPNLARIIGENKYLNPSVYPTEEDFYVVEQFLNDGTRLNQYEGYLFFKPASPIDITISADPGSCFLSRKDTKEEVISSGDYWIDVNTGKFFIYKAPTSTSTTIRYKVSPSNDWTLQKEVLPGIIPDPRQSYFTGCRIEDAGSGTYYLHLPPRQDLDTATAKELPGNFPTNSTHVSNNKASSLDTASRRLWQSESVDAFADAHYRYSLPKEIQETIGSLAVGDVLPAGFLYLWDQNTNTIVNDVIFKKPAVSNTWTLQIESTSLDLSTVATTGESAAAYSSGYSIITVGSSIARNIWQMSNVLFNHKHNNSGDFTTPIDHEDLDGSNPTDSTELAAVPTRLTTAYPWPASNWSKDSHTSLLSRKGSTSTAADQRDALNNAYLGHLLIAQEADLGTESFLSRVLDGTGKSYRVYFGDMDGANIFAEEVLGLGIPLVTIVSGLQVRDEEASVGGILKGLTGSSDPVGMLAVVDNTPEYSNGGLAFGILTGEATQPTVDTYSVNGPLDPGQYSLFTSVVDLAGNESKPIRWEAVSQTGMEEINFSFTTDSAIGIYRAYLSPPDDPTGTYSYFDYGTETFFIDGGIVATGTISYEDILAKSHGAARGRIVGGDAKSWLRTDNLRLIDGSLQADNTVSGLTMLGGDPEAYQFPSATRTFHFSSVGGFSDDMSNLDFAVTGGLTASVQMSTSSMAYVLPLTLPTEGTMTGLRCVVNPTGSSNPKLTMRLLRKSTSASAATNATTVHTIETSATGSHVLTASGLSEDLSGVDTAFYSLLFNTGTSVTDVEIGGIAVDVTMTGLSPRWRS